MSALGPLLVPAEKVLVAVAEAVGTELVLRWVLGRTPEDRARAIVDAAYAAARATADAEAEARFR